MWEQVSQYYLSIINNSSRNQVIQMGCKACQIGADNEDLDFVNTHNYFKQNSSNYKGLLTLNDKQIWLDNLTEPNQPEQDFWTNNSQASHSCFTQIKKDTARSFPNHPFFYSKANMERFETLLKKFAVYFPKVGYTQGLNFLAGYILIAGFDDQNAFKILVRLTLNDKLMLLGLYEDKFPLNRLYCALFWKLLEKRQHSTALKIKLANVLDEIWIFQWFMTFFLYSFPVEFVKRFFDYIICKKQFAMVTLALGIVNCLKSDINNMKDADEFDFFEYMDNLKNIQFCESRIDIEKVISYANSVTKHEITKALEEIKLSKNIYYTYFRREQDRGQIWDQINTKLACQRRIFFSDPRSNQYVRDSNSIEHLERLLLRKSRLYRSRTDSKYSSQIRTSNFTVDIDPGEEIKSDKIEVTRNNHSFGNPYFQEYGGIREGIQAIFQQEKQMKIDQRSIKYSGIQKNSYQACMNTRQNSSAMSKESRNQMKQL